MGNINYIEIGQRIKVARKKKGLTQEKLAEILGLSRRTLIKWEKGELDKEIAFDKFLELCLVLDIDMPYLLGNVYDTKELETVCQYTGLSPKTVKMLHHTSKYTGAAQNVPAFLSDLFDRYGSTALLFLEELEEYMRNSYCEKVLPQKGCAPQTYMQYRDKAALNQIQCENLIVSLKDNVQKDKYIVDRIKADSPTTKAMLEDKEQ